MNWSRNEASANDEYWSSIDQLAMHRWHGMAQLVIWPLQRYLSKPAEF